MGAPNKPGRKRASKRPGRFRFFEKVWAFELGGGPFEQTWRRGTYLGRDSGRWGGHKIRIDGNKPTEGWDIAQIIRKTSDCPPAKPSKDQIGTIMQHNFFRHLGPIGDDLERRNRDKDNHYG